MRLSSVLTWLVAGLTCLLAGDLLAATLLRPVAVPFASGPAFPQRRANGQPPDPQYAATAAIDGNPETFCCLLDDTLGGTDDNTIPTRAAAPVTGTMVFDLGRPYVVWGIRLTGRKDAGGLNPRQTDFFHYADDDPAKHRAVADLEGDSGIRPLAMGVSLPPLAGGKSESVAWDGVVARYIGMRVRSSYESGPVHFNFQLAEVAFDVSPRPEHLAPGSRWPAVYVRQDTLQQTLLACRARLAGVPLSAAIVDKVWEQVRRDFPRTTHRLLDYAPQAWFQNNGWLAHADSTDLEQQLVRKALEQAGPFAEALRAEFELLRGARGPRANEPAPLPTSSAAPPTDRRWLDLCLKAADFALTIQDVQNLRAAVADLAASCGRRYRGDEFLRRIDAVTASLTQTAARPWDPRDARLRLLADDLQRLKHDALVAGNPLLEPKKLLFVKRFTYNPGWYYAEFMRASRFGGNLCVLSVPDGQVTELVPKLSGGIFDRYDLSFDGRRVVFAYKPAPGRGFRLWEVGVDGQGLRQITFDPPDEPQRIEKYWHPALKASGVYRHHTDDFHPCYLPDGRIVFASTRCERGVLCDQGDTLSVNTLYRINADGSGMEMLSEGALSESTPAVMNDGRILYTRWEYVDKGVIAEQNLWAMHPDGTQSCEVYGSGLELPPVLIHARPIPGQSQLFVCTCTMHHPFAVGPIALIDLSRNPRTAAPIRYLTPDTGLSLDTRPDHPLQERYSHLRNGQWVPDNLGPLFSEPYPLADPETGAGAGKYFLVDCNPDRPWGDAAAYGLYLIDVFGNRVRIYHDPQISSWQPMPLRPRAVPPALPSALPAEPSPREATVVMSDVSLGLDGVAAGTVKYLRIWEQVARPWAARRFWPGDETLGQHAVISLNAHIYVKVLHGIVPVREDGSACFVVPADKNLFFQALDERMMEVQRMRTFVNFQPGETRACIGCHQSRPMAPPPRLPLALHYPPDRPRPQPGDTGPRPIHYPTDVQPIFDQHCVRCHNPKKADGELDLSGEATQYFSRSYENIVRRKLVRSIQEFIGPDPHAQTTNVASLPPRALGSHASRLIGIVQAGHYEVKLSEAERVRLVTWADANAPYYGTYFGRRNWIYKDHPDFRPVPTENQTGKAR